MLDWSETGEKQYKLVSFYLVENKEILYKCLKNIFHRCDIWFIDKPASVPLPLVFIIHDGRLGLFRLCLRSHIHKSVYNISRCQNVRLIYCYTWAGWYIQEATSLTWASKANNTQRNILGSTNKSGELCFLSLGKLLANMNGVDFDGRF